MKIFYLKGEYYLFSGEVREENLVSTSNVNFSCKIPFNEINFNEYCFKASKHDFVKALNKTIDFFEQASVRIIQTALINLNDRKDLHLIRVIVNKDDLHLISHTYPVFDIKKLNALYEITTMLEFI